MSRWLVAVVLLALVVAGCGPKVVAPSATIKKDGTIPVQAADMKVAPVSTDPR